MKTSAIWTPYAIIFMGLWLATGPFIFGYQPKAMENDLLCGLALMVLGFLARPQKRVWVPWTCSIIGIWLQFAPLAFWGHAASYLNDSLVGALVVLFSIIIPPIPKQMPDTGPSIPPGWSYNPSSWGQRIPIAVFAIVGWLVSRYLAAYQLGHIDAVWDPFFGDGTLRVITSDVSKAFPVSDAGLGSLAYVTEALLTCQGGERRWRTSPWMVIIFGILVVPLSLVSIILIILQPLVVGAWCTLCLFTAFCMLLPIALSIDEVVAVLQYMKYSKEKPFWKLFLKGGQCPEAQIDTRSPHPSAPLRELLLSSLWGVTAPWNLLVCTAAGLLLMFLYQFVPVTASMKDLSDILGPLIIVVSVISLAEPIRNWRWINLVLIAIVIAGACFFEYASSKESFIAHLALMAVIALSTIRRGPIREKTRYRI